MPGQHVMRSSRFRLICVSLIQLPDFAKSTASYLPLFCHDDGLSTRALKLGASFVTCGRIRRAGQSSRFANERHRKTPAHFN